MEEYTCKECNKKLREDNFFILTDGTRMEICKECFTKDVNPTIPMTFTPLLKQMDFPYIKQVWDNLRRKFPSANGHNIFRKYVATMKLYSYKNYRWKDSQILNNFEDKEE